MRPLRRIYLYTGSLSGVTVIVLSFILVLFLPQSLPIRIFRKSVRCFHNSPSILTSSYTHLVGRIFLLYSGVKTSSLLFTNEPKTKPILSILIMSQTRWRHPRRPTPRHATPRRATPSQIQIKRRK